MKAFLNVKDRQNYKKAELVEGVKRLGYQIVKNRVELPIQEDSLLLTWNLHSIEEPAKQLRHAGGKVIVAENPYVKYDKDGEEYLALQLNGHNGSGTTPTGGTERLEKLGLDFKPWRGGFHILVAGQRGIGAAAMRSPWLWEQKVTTRIRSVTGRQVVVRPHPGRVPRGQVLPPLDKQLAGAHSVVVWASNVATTALLAGIPVFYEAPYVTLALAAKRGVKDIERPWKGDRVPAFTKLSWSQWSLSEIRTGEALKRILECTSTPQPTSFLPPSARPLLPGSNCP